MNKVNILIVVLLLGGWIGGKLFSKIKLPAILGMMIFGIAVGEFVRDIAPDVFWELAPLLRSTALIIILLRAGLGIKRAALAKSGITAVMLAFIPCTLEGFALTGIFYYFWGFDFFTAGLTGFMVSAVSPAVVVPSMLNLMEQGYGKAREVPTTILAGASVDDVIAITLFTVFLNLASGSHTTEDIHIGRILISIPLSIIGAIAIGVIIGFLLTAYFRKYFKHIRATEKFMILLAVSVMFVEIGTSLHLAALLGIMTIGLVLVEKADHIANELAKKLSKAWVIAEIILFVLIGVLVNIQVAMSVGLMGVATIFAGLIARSIGVVISMTGSAFNRNERLFCIIAYIPKATVQAALGSVPLALGLAHGQTILSLAVLAILITAPMGLLSIRLLGPRLLGTQFNEETDE